MDATSKPEVQDKNILIIDTNAFIRCVDLSKLAQEYDIYTTNNVLNEIKDKKAKDKFLAINFDLKTKSCDQKSFNNVCEFAKRTGDYASLSFIDKEVIALAVLIVSERKKSHLLRKNPPKMSEYIPTPKNNIGEFSLVEGNADSAKSEENKDFTDNKPPQENVKPEIVVEEGKDSLRDNDNGFENIENKNTAINKGSESQEFVGNKVADTDDGFQVVKSKHQNNLEDGEDDDEEGGEWINSSNITKVLYRAKKNDETVNALGVAIMTTDFAMQNVSIQMGIPILAIDGMIIKQTRKWVLECYACKSICNIPTKEFCPSCGNHTLLKLSVRINDDGTSSYYRNPKKKINTRGQIFPIPQAKGGRKNNDLILREDELLMGSKLNKMLQIEKDKDRLFREAYSGYGNGISFDDISRGNKREHLKFEIGYGKINPNDPMAFKRKNRKT